MTQVECIQETLKHIKRVEQLLNQTVSKLLEHSFTHDASKLAEPELSIFTEFTPKLKDSIYNSEEYKTFLKDMKIALDHHYSTNAHHPECHNGKIENMNLIEIMEMLADWKAASERHIAGSLHDSIIKNQERFGYSDAFKEILFNTEKYLNW